MTKGADFMVTAPAARIRCVPTALAFRNGYTLPEPTPHKSVHWTAGTIHLIYSHPGSGDVLHSYSQDAGLTWTHQTILSYANPGEQWTDYDVHTDGERLYLFWGDDQGNDADLYAKQTSADGVTWGSKTLLGTLVGYADLWVSLWVESASRRHYLYSWKRVADNMHRLEYRFNESATAELVRSVGPQAFSNQLPVPGAVVDETGKLWAFFLDLFGPTDDLSVSRRDNAAFGSGAWEVPVVIGQNRGVPNFDPLAGYAVMPRAGSGMHVGWTDDDDIHVMYREHDGSAWLTAQTIPLPAGVTLCWGPGFYAPAAGPVLVFLGYEKGIYAIPTSGISGTPSLIVPLTDLTGLNASSYTRRHAITPTSGRRKNDIGFHGVLETQDGAEQLWYYRVCR